MRSYFGLLITVSLAGCVSDQVGQQQAVAVQQRVLEQMASCASKGGTHATVARCQNAALLAGAEQTRPRDADLIQLGAAANLSVAEKLDRKEITQAQADLELAQIGAQINTEKQKRDAVAQIQNTAAAQENAAYADTVLSLVRASGSALAAAHQRSAQR